ncbi:MAG: tetratricopeptide repeat protein, partial [Candidatus Adiutrix sp.]|nr:tetratricopeptide repeat protein [Candidatus Adiutrix sp.]
MLKILPACLCLTLALISPLALVSTAQGQSDPKDEARAASNQADKLYRQGDYQGASLLYQQGLDLLTKSVGPEHPSTLTSLSNLAATYRDLGDYARALELDQKALEARERILGPEHPDTLTS